MREWRYWSVAVLVFAVVAIAVPLGALHLTQFWGEWTATSHDSNQWQLPGVWGFHAYDVVNALLLLATLVFVIRSIWVAEAALNKSHHSYVQALVDTRYDAMDRLYFDLLRERRERPYPWGGSEQEKADDPYPLMVWNFIETIIDKCEEDPSGKLMKTWAPLISAEACKFGFYVEALQDAKPVNSLYFKNEFMLLARALVPASKTALGNGDDLDGPVFLRLFRAVERISDMAGKKRPARDELDAWLAKEVKRRKFPGFADDEAFLSCFDEIHRAPAARKLATKDWELPEDIRHDDLKNNEKAREQFIRDRYRGLIEVVLPQVTASVRPT